MVEPELQAEAVAKRSGDERAASALSAYIALYERDPHSSRIERMKAALRAADQFDAQIKSPPPTKRPRPARGVLV